MNKKGKKGLLFLPLVFYLMAAGIIFVVSGRVYYSYQEWFYEKSVQERLLYISKSLDNFAIQNGRLPEISTIEDEIDRGKSYKYYGIEIDVARCEGSGSGSSKNCYILSDRSTGPEKMNVGVIPFQELGIENKLQKDEDGTEITYLVFDNLTSKNGLKTSKFLDIDIVDYKNEVLIDKNTMGGVAYILIHHGRRKIGAFNSDKRKQNKCEASTGKTSKTKSIDILKIERDFVINCDYRNTGLLKLGNWNYQFKVKKKRRIKSEYHDFIFYRSVGELKSSYYRKKN